MRVAGCHWIITLCFMKYHKTQKKVICCKYNLKINIRRNTNYFGMIYISNYHLFLLSICYITFLFIYFLFFCLHFFFNFVNQRALNKIKIGHLLVEYLSCTLLIDIRQMSKFESVSMCHFWNQDLSFS